MEINESRENRDKASLILKKLKKLESKSKMYSLNLGSKTTVSSNNPENLERYKTLKIYKNEN